MNLDVSNESGYHSFIEDAIPVHFQPVQRVVGSRMARILLRLDNATTQVKLIFLVLGLNACILIALLVSPSSGHIFVLTGVVIGSLIAAIYSLIKWRIRKLNSLRIAMERRMV
ncbi:hypothetical protein TNIN_95791 [Trichonephila inaurata madagascariensis]|uniref:Uncharacterized protein n=1 Tax=Trichonephila inaurata madagascariensis TaxID=2747483 RepID=A0A8X6X7Q5_9ARAC|nr:hypothetical protein TNIN_95791 [Trichonephila inaurata madagascariensis]